MNSGKLILLAEDSEDEELFFRYAMRRAGLRNPVVAVRNSRDTIAYLKGEYHYADRQSFPLPDILLLDLMMPGGWEVLLWVRSQAEFNDMLLVVLTGPVRVEDLQRAYRMGANSFLVKRCSATDLADLASCFPKHWIRSSSLETPGPITNSPPSPISPS